jgi:hypothetical protein
MLPRTQFRIAKMVGNSRNNGWYGVRERYSMAWKLRLLAVSRQEAVFPWMCKYVKPEVEWHQPTSCLTHKNRLRDWICKIRKLKQRVCFCDSSVLTIKFCCSFCRGHFLPCDMLLIAYFCFEYLFYVEYVCMCLRSELPPTKLLLKKSFLKRQRVWNVSWFVARDKRNIIFDRYN